MLLLPTVQARPKHERTPSETPDDQTLEQAQKSLQAARAALLAHDSAEAYRRAAEAFRLVPSPEALLTLGRVALAEKRLLDAQDLLRRYLADPNLESAPNSPDQEEAQRIADSVRPSSSKLNILGDRGTLVTVDGRLVGALPLSRPLLFSPSEHKVELDRGDRHLEDQVRVPAGRLGELRLDLKTRALLLSALPGVIVLDQYPAKLAEAQKRKLEHAVEEAVQAERLSPLPRDLALELAGEPEPGPCPDERRCLLDLAEKCEADYLLRVHVEEQKGLWDLAMELVDVTVGDVAAREETSCAACGVEQAAQRLSTLFGPIYKKASERPRGQLEVRSTPADAELLLDGQRLGKTPYQAAAWAGPRQLLLRKEDYQEEHRELTIRDGETTRLEVTLRLVPEPPPAPLQESKQTTFVYHRMPRPLWRLGLGAVSLAAGGLLLGFGASGLYFNNRCVNGSPDSATCPVTYTTLLPGVTLTVSGILVMGAGGLLLALPGPRRQVEVFSP
jgi:hypothetical protein